MNTARGLAWLGAAALTALAMLTAPGCGPAVSCGAGASEVDGVCVADLICGDGTVAQDGQCILASLVCKPDCVEKACGDDGCGGSCGECTDPGAPLCEGGVCVGACAPDCDGKVCGDDGCGGLCGVCDAGSECNLGACEEVPPERSCRGFCGGINPLTGCACQAQCEPGFVARDGVCVEADVVSVSVGAEHACALDASDRVRCWGRNDLRAGCSPARCSGARWGRSARCRVGASTGTRAWRRRRGAWASRTCRSARTRRARSARAARSRAGREARPTS